jgi:hypothetical protein
LRLGITANGFWFGPSFCTLAQKDNVAKDNLALFGEVKIRVKGAGEHTTPPQATLILYSPSGKELARPTGPERERQKVTNGGRYRFSDLTVGEYELVVEIDQHEVSRTRIFLSSLHAPYGLEQDIVVDWQPPGDATKSPTTSVVDVHERTPANKRLFKKAEDAVAENDYDQAISFLTQLVANDKADYQAQTILGTLLASKGKDVEAEQAYLSALSAKPTFPPALLNAIDRMMPMLRFFRHGDGSFALFNGMSSAPSDLLATLLAYDDSHGTPMANMPHTGFQRLESGTMTVIMDTGPPPPPSVSHDAHAGCLSFELSSGPSRIVINCGMPSTGRDS